MKNIRLAYYINFLMYSWFWLGIWLFYYLRFTNYIGVALIEMTQITVGFLAEIPTGALADLIGRKKTIILAFGLITIGQFIFALASSLAMIILSVAILALGYALYSGTFEALIYDTLKENQKEKSYEEVWGKINSTHLLALAITGIIGGAMYMYHFRLPFIATAITSLIGFFLSLYLIEPRIDSEKFSWSSFAYQNKEGFKQLFSTIKGSSIIIYFLLPLFAANILYEILHDALVINYGYIPFQAGILATVIYLVASIVSFISGSVIKKFDSLSIVLLISIFLSLTLLISPYLGMALGGMAIIFRVGLSALLRNTQSVFINRFVESKYRATTLSTFTMLSNLPYVIVALFVGKAIDLYSAKILAFFLGTLLTGVVLYQLLVLFFIKYEKIKKEK